MLARRTVAAGSVADWQSGAESPQGGSEQEAPHVHGFVGLDRWLAQGNGFAVVMCDASLHDAIADHVARRLAPRGKRVVRAGSSGASEGFRDLLSSLGSSPFDVPRSVALTSNEERVCASSARELAAKLESALVAAEPRELAGVVLVDRRPSLYSQTVAAELEALFAQRVDDADAFAPGTESQARPIVPVVWVVPSAPMGSTARELRSADSTSLREEVRFEIDAALDSAAIAAWWSSASAAPFSDWGGSGAPVSVDDLERWWRSARVRARSLAHPSDDGGLCDGSLVAAARCLALAARPWPLARLGALAVCVAQAEALVDECAADIRDGLVTLRGTFSSKFLPAFGGVSQAEAEAIAGALTSVFPGDPWASMRASELLLATGAVEQGDRLCIAALTTVLDPEARADFWARFVAVSPSPTPSAARLLPFVEAALRGGDGEFALRLARDAVAVDAGDPRVVLAMGRALAASGDLTAAAMTLTRATQATWAGADVIGRAWVELAEVRYFASDVAGAREAASQAITQVADEGRTALGVRLDARNVIGKLLLAEGHFPAADRHFAQDACEASLAGQPVGELRARVNRAIALMSLGRRTEAQGMLEVVLGEGESLGELKAVGIALINLAALAILDHRYGDALDLSERAVEVLRRIGDKVSLARCIANLAELRLRVGLLDEATQAVRFGGRIFRGGAPAEQSAQFALILARVALARGDSAAAHHQIAQALASLGRQLPSASGETSVEHTGVSRGPVREHVSEALRLAARIAIDDGDTARAELLIERAAAERAPRRARADLASLRALLARALGAPFEALAGEAVSAAREAGDDELLRESHGLLARAALDRGAPSVAHRHLEAAAAVRDRVLDGLPGALRPMFLARRDVRQLERETAQLDGAVGMESPPSQSPTTLATPSKNVPQTSHAIGLRDARPYGGAARARRIVGDDPSIRSLLRVIRRVGPAEATVLIHGESGTGKELVAEALHEASGRNAGPLVKVNCAAPVETLLLSELFGHEKGAFTGASARRRGRFEAAEGGTLFLDEIGDISPRTQVALLRVLQERSFERVGGTAAISANVRVVCATHRDLAALVQRGELREDLYYRLAGVVVQVPALRCRLGDLGAISNAILARTADERGGPVKGLSDRALSALRSHTWPGNVRELENALRAASLFADGDLLEPEDFADNVESLRHISETVDTLAAGPTSTSRRGDAPPTSECPGTDSAPGLAVKSRPSVAYPSESIKDDNAPSSSPSDVAYAQVRAGVCLHDMKRLIERDCIARALSDAGGNITRAATLLGMKRPRLSQLVKQYGLGAGIDGADSVDDVSGAASCAAEEE